MSCYKPTSGCGVYENRSCSECPYSRPPKENKKANSYKKIPLEPCPFCGGLATPRMHKKNNAYCHGFIEVYIQCDTCLAKGPSFDDFRNNDDVPGLANKATEAWNRRTHDLS